MNFIQSSRNATMKWQGKDRLIVTVKLETGEFTQFLIDFSDSIPVMKELSNSFSDVNITEDEIKFKFVEELKQSTWLKWSDYPIFRTIYVNVLAEKKRANTKHENTSDEVISDETDVLEYKIQRDSEDDQEVKEMTNNESNSNEE
jgi:hypothetical protein